MTITTAPPNKWLSSTLTEDTKHFFIGLNNLAFVVLTMLCLMIGALLRRYSHKMWWLPESAATMLVGIIIGLIITFSSRQEALFIKFSPEVFFFVLLPPIILDAGYTLKKRNFFANLGTILLYAVIGTIISALTFGYALYALAYIGLIPPLAVLECLLFGSLVSATDTVATLAVMSSKHRVDVYDDTAVNQRYNDIDTNNANNDHHVPFSNNRSPGQHDSATTNPSTADPIRRVTNAKYATTDPLLYSIVFGESVLNDAVGIVLYQTFKNYIELKNAEPQGSDSFELGIKGLMQILATFIGVSAGSLAIGIGVALSCCFLFKRVGLANALQLGTGHNSSATGHIEFIMVGLFSYLAYFLAEIVELSGIMSLFFCSVCLAHYNYWNISPRAQVTTQDAFKGLAHIAETFVFVYVGITAGLSITQATGSSLPWSFSLVLFTTLFGLLSRLFNIIPLTALANIVRSSPIPWRMQQMLCFSQLRGAVAFALSLNFPTKHKGIVVTSTLAFVLFTTLVGGGLTLPMLRKTGNLVAVDDKGTARDTSNTNGRHRSKNSEHYPTTPAEEEDGHGSDSIPSDKQVVGLIRKNATIESTDEEKSPYTGDERKQDAPTQRSSIMTQAGQNPGSPAGRTLGGHQRHSSSSVSLYDMSTIGSPAWRIQASDLIREYKERQLGVFGRWLSDLDNAYMKPYFGGNSAQHQGAIYQQASTDATDHSHHHNNHHFHDHNVHHLPRVDSGHSVHSVDSAHYTNFRTPQVTASPQMTGLSPSYDHRTLSPRNVSNPLQPPVPATRSLYTPTSASQMGKLPNVRAHSAGTTGNGMDGSSMV